MSTTKPSTAKPLRQQPPKYAIVPNKGKGKVLEYNGKGYFTVLLPNNIRIFVHRRDLKFTNKTAKDK
jgi:hypothetical protein